MLTASPTIQYRGDFVPTTPATTAPTYRHTSREIKLERCKKVLGECGTPRPEGPNIKAQRNENGGTVLGGGGAASRPPYRRGVCG